jgi:hypothetical protein
MATPQLSPGVLTREVDLTVGRAENVLDNIGAIAGPFLWGPVEEPVTILNEKELLDVFGKPSIIGDQYEYWMSASSYLSYGGIMKVVRCDSQNLINSNAAVGSASTSIKIKNFDDYNFRFSNSIPDFYFSSKTPGSWANGLKVCIIDNAADQIISFNQVDLNELGIVLGTSFTVPLQNVNIVNPNGSISNFTGVLKGIVTEVFNNTSKISIKIISLLSSDGIEIPIDYSQNNRPYSILQNDTLTFRDSSGNILGSVGAFGTILDINFFDGTTILGQEGVSYENILATGGSGTGATFNVLRDSNGDIETVTISNGGSGYNEDDTIIIPGNLIGGEGGQIQLVTYSGTSVGGEDTFEEVFAITILGEGSGASFNVIRNSSGEIEEIEINSPGSGYKIGDQLVIAGDEVGGDNVVDDVTIIITSITDEDAITIVVTNITKPTELDAQSVVDWYNEQKITLETSTISWKSIAEKPTTTDYAVQRGGKNDSIHIVVIDDLGSITGIKGNILEKHLNLSKSKDAISAVNFPDKIWYKDYLATYSRYIYAGKTPSESPDNFHLTNPVATSFSSGFVLSQVSSGIWEQNSSNTSFNVIGNKVYNLFGGSDYFNGSVDLSSILASYDKFSNKDEIDIDFLICGPSGNNPIESQAKANKLISIANERKDCLAVISPHKNSILNITDTNTQTNNIVNFFGPLQSSSYTVFDSGYKYTYDRFNNKFVYIACNADVAGLMARTTLNSFPWYSPAGQQRGVLNNAVKLAYNPGKNDRDTLYSSRVNSIINLPGAGIILYGDKTALSYASAFDRINIRRLFLVVQKALERAANAQLFEFNDQITRSNFVNIIEPYLRDIQAKRGVFDFRVICDESNNTPDVIDNNEFRADIFLKPTRSINYVTLTFVATRTGVSFEEVAGNV